MPSSNAVQHNLPSYAPICSRPSKPQMKYHFYQASDDSSPHVSPMSPHVSLLCPPMSPHVPHVPPTPMTALVGCTHHQSQQRKINTTTKHSFTRLLKSPSLTITAHLQLPEIQVHPATLILNRYDRTLHMQLPLPDLLRLTKI